MWRILLLALSVSVCGLLPTGCTSSSNRDAKSETQKPTEPEVYRYRYEGNYYGLGAKDVQVEMTKEGTYRITATSDDSYVPGVLSTEDKGMVQLPDVPNSKNIKIAINKEVGYTDYAGLRFEQQATVNVWDNGTVEVDREGVQASDKSGILWISKKIPLEFKEFIVMVKK